MKALAVISTVLLLLFVYLWYDQKSDAELARDQKAEAEKARDDALKLHQDVEGHLGRVSGVVGFQEGQFTAEKLIDVAKAMDEIRANSKIRVPREFWKAPAEDPAVKVTPVDLSKFPADLLQKIRSLEPPSDPPPPPDEDADEAERAKYAADKAEYDKKVEAYEAAVKEISSHPAFPEYKRAVGPASTLGLEKPDDLIEVDFFATPPAGSLQLEQVVKQPGPVLARMRAAFEANKAADIATIVALRKELAEKEKVITSPDEAALGLKEQLAKEQAAHTADVGRLQAEIESLTAKAEGFRVEASNAQNELAKAKEAAAQEKRRLEAERDALREYQRTTKEQADLEIRRNDPDGTVLDANVTLGTGYIDLGRVDRVFPGLKFEVYGVGRGGFRLRKGVVLVQEVLDAHYSQVTILSQDDESRPLVRGDTIHNPFYSPTKTIHVFLAGDLKKYPKSIAVQRLRRANVVVDDALSAQTDYVVVPDTLTAPAPAAPTEEGAEPAPAAGAQTEYDRLRERARTFGATLVTERQLESFLDY
jgi:hypothetical protein